MIYSYVINIVRNRLFIPELPDKNNKSMDPQDKKESPLWENGKLTTIHLGMWKVVASNNKPSPAIDFINSYGGFPLKNPFFGHTGK